MQNPIRVLQLAPGSGTGGMLKVSMSMYRNIDKRRVQFDFASIQASTLMLCKEEIELAGGHTYELNIRGNVITRKLKFFTTFFHLIKKHNYKFVHVNSGTIFMQLSALGVAKCVGVPVRIAHSHNAGVSGEYKILKYMLQTICKPLLPVVATHYFACSRLAADWMFSKKIIESEQVKIINNGIDVQRFIYNQQVRNEYRSLFRLENRFVIGHIGRFENQKNHEFLVDIFHELYKQNHQSSLLLVGEGELVDAIKEKVKKLRLTGVVQFLGVRSDIAQLLQAIDVFVFPSHFEGLGIVAIEAQAAGLKVVASDVVPKEAQITDFLEYVSLEQSAEEWVKVILQYQNGYERRNTYNELVDAGFDIRETARELEEYYLEAIGNLNANRK